MQKVLKKINELATEIGRDVQLMEVCGSHTQAISRHGIRQLIPKNIKLITGPGCPVCITAQKDIDAIIHIAQAGIPVATYGDVMQVSGYYGSLETAKSKGASITEVYSAEEALTLHKKYPEMVFFGLGFETTTPMSAYAIKNGLTVYSTHKLFIPAMYALLKAGEIRIDGFISPGHVSAITGLAPYKDMGVAQVITGFKADDVLVGIYMLLRQIAEGRKEVENEYVRLVRNEGNTTAYNLMLSVFDVADGEWRGLGNIPESGLEIKKEYEEFNAKIKHKNILEQVDFSKSVKPAGCRCGEIVRGLIEPVDCPLFGKMCHPGNPKGPCMVSSEGACNVEYVYGKK